MERNKFYMYSNRLMKQHSKTVSRYNFLALRIINESNFLSGEFVNEATLDIFKMKRRILLQ